jgi:hypothetical protein
MDSAILKAQLEDRAAAYLIERGAFPFFDGPTRTLVIKCMAGYAAGEVARALLALAFEDTEQ